MRYLMMLLAAFAIGYLVTTVALAEGEVYDPNQINQAHLVCTAPVTRADGTALAVGEIDRFEFYRLENDTWVQVGSEDTCRMLLTLPDMPDGQYYYAVTAMDTGGRESERSATHPFVLRRVQPPSAPTDLRLMPVS